MKKKWAVMLAVSLVMGMTGCTVNSKNEENTISETEEVVEDVTEDTEEITYNTEDVIVATEEEEQNVNVLITYETTEQERTLDDGTVILQISYMKPTITIENNADAQGIIQDAFDQMETDFYMNMDEVESEARLFFEEGEPVDGISFYSAVTYSNMRIDDTVISLSKEDADYRGGAHGYGAVYGLNYDVKTGNILLLDDITDDKDAFVAQVKDVIIDKCDNGEYEEAVFPDYKEYIDDVICDDCWYFDEEGITFLANPYLLGPYASGLLTFTIPYDDMVGVKDEYKK